MRVLTFGVIAVALLSAACTVGRSETPALTGPSGLATSLTVTANPDTIALGQTATTPGQQSLIIVSVIDANGQPKPNQTVRLETLVNGQLSACGQIARNTLITGSDGRASTLFIAPGTPPNCPNFSADGTVTIRATPVGADFQATSSSATGVSVFMALPTFAIPVSGFTVNFSISPNPGTVGAEISFSDAGSFSPGHSIVGFRWNWSDGATKTGASVMHDFGTAGTYTVTLTVTDDIGQTAFKTALFTVNAAAAPPPAK